MARLLKRNFLLISINSENYGIKTLPEEVSQNYELINDCWFDYAIPKLEDSVQMSCDFAKLDGYSTYRFIVLDQINNDDDSYYYKLRIFEFKIGKDLKNIELAL